MIGRGHNRKFRHAGRDESRGWPRICFAIVAAIAVAGCHRSAPSSKAATQPAVVPVEKTAERGPVKLRVRLNKNRVTIAEPFELEIEATAEPNVDVTMPKFGQQLLEFAIRDFREQSPRSEEQKRIWRQTYTLDSFVSGKFELPAIEVSFKDRRKNGQGATSRPAIASSVRAEPIALEVESLLEGKFDPRQFNDIKGPVWLPRARSWVIAAWIAGTVAALLAIGAAAWRIRKRQEGSRTARMPPHQWALLELERLLADDLISRGQISEFYYRLNGLLRRYIELRFGLAAAEQTSEEFLRALQTDQRLSDAHKSSLREFIAACDPVKYARYRPGKEEIEQVFSAARDFILRTQQREQEVELEPLEAAA